MITLVFTRGIIANRFQRHLRSMHTHTHNWKFKGLLGLTIQGTHHVDGMPPEYLILLSKLVFWQLDSIYKYKPSSSISAVLFIFLLLKYYTSKLQKFYRHNLVLCFLYAFSDRVHRLTMIILNTLFFDHLTNDFRSYLPPLVTLLYLPPLQPNASPCQQVFLLLSCPHCDQLSLRLSGVAIGYYGRRGSTGWDNSH